MQIGVNLREDGPLRMEIVSMFFSWVCRTGGVASDSGPTSSFVNCGNRVGGGDPFYLPSFSSTLNIVYENSQ